MVGRIVIEKPFFIEPVREKFISHSKYGLYGGAKATFKGLQLSLEHVNSEAISKFTFMRKVKKLVSQIDIHMHLLYLN